MNDTLGTVNTARGLSLLMMHEKCTYFTHLDQCSGYTNTLSTHPFGLDIPKQNEVWRALTIDFVGANATDMSVEVFLANIRFWAGYIKEHGVTKLRVVNMPFNNEAGKHYVFFEIWVASKVIISGETTDCSGAGNAARQELEDVFAVLAQVYGLEIERVLLRHTVKIQTLYAEK